MAGLSSANCTFTYSGSAVSGLVSASISLDQSMIDITNISTGPRSYVLGNRGATITVDMFYDQGDVGVAALETAANGGGSAAFSLVLTNAGGGMSYSGNAFVTAFSPSAATQEVLRASATLQVTGALTIS
jgi:predicted secreted protein